MGEQKTNGFLCCIICIVQCKIDIIRLGDYFNSIYFFGRCDSYCGKDNESEMTNSDLKLTILNSFSLLASFSNIESSLKIILLLVSIAYTILKIYEIFKKKTDGTKIDS